MVKSIYFGAGCFWCSEAVFTRLRGIVSVQSGYAGGTTANPTYWDVVAKKTGHVEVVRVKYDSQIIKLAELLSVFFATHDPTTPNRQGYDIGTQYRSAIYYQHSDDKKVIENYIANLTKDQIFKNPIVTEVREVKDFYPAEADHYRYYDMNKSSAYCTVIIDPKLAKLRQSFAHLLKK